MSKLALLGGEKAVTTEPHSAGHHRSPMWESGKAADWEEFSAAFAKKMQVEYALPVSSGQVALNSALTAAQAGPGDEVIVPSFTWIASVSCIMHNNAVPIFADVDPKTYTLDPEDVRRKITHRTKAIIAVDLYGHPVDLKELLAIAREHDIVLIEDSAQATGAQVDGQIIGGIADITCFSFAGKPIAATSGGVMTTNSREYYERGALGGQHPSTLSKILTNSELLKYASTGGYGDNHRIDRYAMTVAYEALETFEEANEARIANCDLLTQELSKVKGITPPYVAPGVKHVYHMYSSLYNEEELGVPREAFVKALNAEGVTALTYVNSANFLFHPGGKPMPSGPIHHRAIFQEKNVYGHGCPFQCPHYDGEADYSLGSLPVTEKLVDQEFNFLQPHLSAPNGPDQMEQFLDAVTKVVDNIGDLEGWSEL